jgi:hypothetical protein
MNRRSWPRGAGLVAMLILLAGCASGQASAPPVRSLAGGCSGTVLRDSEPPAWAQGGFTHTKGTPWPVPWALGTPGDAVAHVFAAQLVAGGRRPNGTSNKVLWVVRDNPSFVVEGRPLGQTQPVVTVPGGPSIVDVPAPGCWTFQLSWGSHPRHLSTIDLEVLPADTLASS